jgi:hypothetical protein
MKEETGERKAKSQRTKETKRKERKSKSSCRNCSIRRARKAAASSNYNFGLTEDSNTCFSMVSDSQGPTDFSAQLGFSEDSKLVN